jgi:hypothetical protein
VISEELRHATNNLRAHAPEQWKSFIEQLTAHATSSRDFCIHAPVEQLQVAQGRAQALSLLVKDLSESHLPPRGNGKAK